MKTPEAYHGWDWKKVVLPSTPPDPYSTTKTQLKWEKVALTIATKMAGYVQSREAVNYILDKVRNHLDVPKELTACEFHFVGSGVKSICKLINGHKGAHIDPETLGIYSPSLGHGKVVF